MQAVPLGLVATVSSASVAAATSAGITLTTLKVMTMTKLKAGAISALILAGAVTPLVIQHQSVRKLREDNRTLAAQNRQLAESQTEHDRLANLLAQTEQRKSLSDEQLRELLRLRGEVNLLRKESQELAKLRMEQKKTRQHRKAPCPETKRCSRRMRGPMSGWKRRKTRCKRFSGRPDMIMRISSASSSGGKKTLLCRMRLRGN